MPILTIPSESKEYLHVPVTGTGSLSDYPVEIAVVPYGTDPTSPAWKTAVWDGASAKVLIGPGTSLELVAGPYGVWVRITTSQERPVLYAGPMKIS
ncbi:hypothetical protein Sme01_03150 [Sphaerisporangium melleum]|uniref:Uncharacterized protein n=1 Tax=Sphaerisporangium melleum TaxID=321316 RepID=A0A917QNV0_9ACTN|nr:hypothetical protein [Sphaerisporangium melleum]GGK61465.1 hypothetical protein GCM10007964_00690 [Sphaerisporangium melleum]GII67839.1 hypothetical protein Sme01_03150 [Sphaerisporangium melleum]